MTVPVWAWDAAPARARACYDAGFREGLMDRTIGAIPNSLSIPCEALVTVPYFLEVMGWHDVLPTWLGYIDAYPEAEALWPFRPERPTQWAAAVMWTPRFPDGPNAN